MEKTLKVYKDEILDVITVRINNCQNGIASSTTFRGSKMAKLIEEFRGGIYEEIRDTLIQLREVIATIPLETKEEKPTGAGEGEKV